MAILQGNLSRREVLARAAITATSLSLAVSLSAATRQAHAKVSPKPDVDADNDILNALLTAEYGAIAAYTAGAGIIADDDATPQATRDVVTAVAVHFQDQHKDHAAALKAMIEDNGGTAAEDTMMANIPDSFDEPTTAGVMKLAADKEKHAAIAYANVMKTISTQAAAKLVASIGAVETQHYVVLELLISGLIQANDMTAMNPALIVPASFVLEVSGSQALNLEKYPALDSLLELAPAT